MSPLTFTLHRLGRPSEAASFVPRSLVIAGWTGRDAAAVEHHVRELEAIGVPRPSQVPLFYRVSAALLTQADAIEVLGGESSGEAEPVIFGFAGELWLTVGSDHTDRKVEAYSVAVAKQMCAKPVARDAWRLAEVAADWDALELSATIVENGKPVRYQDGPLARMRTPADLVARYAAGAATLPDGVMMSCGTLAAIGGVRPAAQMTIELADRARGRSLRHAYRVETLPVVR